jgi:hypothetical protein
MTLVLPLALFWLAAFVPACCVGDKQLSYEALLSIRSCCFSDYLLSRPEPFDSTSVKLFQLHRTILVFPFLNYESARHFQKED